MEVFENLYMTKQFYTVFVPVFLTTIIINHLLKSSKLALPNMFFTYKSYYLITIYNFVLYTATRFFRNINFPDGFYLSDKINKCVELTTFENNINSIKSRKSETGKPTDTKYLAGIKEMFVKLTDLTTYNKRGKI